MKKTVRCEKCNKWFEKNEDLEKHNSKVHIEKKKEKKAYKIKISKTYVIVAVILLAIVAFAFTRQAPEYTPVTTASIHSKGPVDASVVVTEYSDFQCPFCGQFYTNTESLLINEYVNTGRVRFIYKHYPLTNIHPYALKAAEASECAAEQGKFWEYHDVLFENQQSLSIGDLKRYAAQVELNQELFDNCLDSGAMNLRVVEDIQEGNSRGVRSTPTIFINDELVQGAQPFNVIKPIIDRELAK